MATPSSVFASLADAIGSTSLSAVFLTSDFKSLASNLRQLTTVAAFELLAYSSKEVSLPQGMVTAGLGNALTGATLEFQILTLDGSMHKQEARDAVGYLLNAVLDIYDGSIHPLRRARSVIFVSSSSRSNTYFL